MLTIGKLEQYYCDPERRCSVCELVAFEVQGIGEAHNIRVLTLVSQALSYILA